MTREDELLKKLKQGDESCLDELIMLFYPDIFRYCLRHTANQQMAEDATQETFLKMIRYLDSYTHKGKFKAFIYKIASNICIDLWRKTVPETIIDEHPYDENGFREVTSNIDFYQMIQILPQDQQEILLLRFMHELKIREIAELLDLPVRTAQSRLRSALKQLKKNFPEGVYCNGQEKV